MRAAYVADFYMTKYLSKTQEALGPVIQPIIAAMHRIATALESTLVQRARQMIRRFTFCANRSIQCRFSTLLQSMPGLVTCLV